MEHYKYIKKLFNAKFVETTFWSYQEGKEIQGYFLESWPENKRYLDHERMISPVFASKPELMDFINTHKDFYLAMHKEMQELPRLRKKSGIIDSKTVDPYEFENLIVEYMIKMGHPLFNRTDMIHEYVIKEFKSFMEVYTSYDCRNDDIVFRLYVDKGGKADSKCQGTLDHDMKYRYSWNHVKNAEESIFDYASEFVSMSVIQDTGWHLEGLPKMIESFLREGAKNE